MKDALVKLAPGGAEAMTSRHAALEKELQELDARLKKAVAAHPDREGIFSHPVYQYLERRYGLNGRSLHWEPHEMPSDAKWQELATLIASHPAEWMIWEATPSPEIATRLAAQAIQSVVFNPCAGAPDGGDFVSVMKLNAAALKIVLED